MYCCGILTQLSLVISVHLTCRVCVCVCCDPGADEPDVSGDSEAGSDGRGVVPQTEAGQHGRDEQQRTDAGRRQ